MNVLNIALVSETYPPEINGVATTLGRLVSGLRDRGHRVTVVRPRQDSDVDVPTDPETVLVGGFPIPGCPGLRFGMPAGALLQRRWSDERPDLVHLVTEGPLGNSALAVARRLNLPITSGFHTNFDGYCAHYKLGLLRRPVAWWLRRFHNRTHGTLVPSQDLLDDLTRRGFRDLHLVGRGVDTTLFHPGKRDPRLRESWGAQADDPVFLHVGRIAPEKDLPLALDTVRVLRARHPTLRLVVVGDGPLRESLEKAYPEAVFTGAVPLAELARIYASADAFLFPSQSETFGNVLLEALASGLPSVSFDYAAAKRHVRHGVNGLVAPFGDAAAWRAEAARLAQDHTLRIQLRPAARASALEVGWTPVVERFLGILSDTVARHRAGTTAQSPVIPQVHPCSSTSPA